MLPNLKRLLLGISLIVLASTVLLLSDLKRRTSSTGAIPHIGLLQHASVVLLDDTVRGMVDSLAENGFVDGRTIVIQKYNAQGDIGVANSIAKEMVNAHFDLLLTASTLSLQAVANANRGGKTVQVFGAVADPAVAGVGISHDNPLDHPRNLVGIGSFFPVAEAFRIAREMFPGLKRVGVAWNPAEANSRAYTEKAREACQAMNIELLEANVENSNGVVEAEDSLVARGAQALWIGGDVTVSIAVDSVISVGQKAGIPVFSITPGKPDRGTLFDYGADFYQIGKQTGELAVRVLRGADPSQIPITYQVPELLVVNTQALEGLRDSWRVPDDLLRRADVVVDGAGIHRKRSVAVMIPHGRGLDLAGRKELAGTHGIPPSCRVETDSGGH
jgi:putative tryptophan/tyrosine transport system substrate-binding protein